MGRSQETVGKKEKQKKKLQKRKEKLEKREERKANNNKGKGIDSMLAWIDEDGNICDAPPDPAKRKEINLEDIQLGARQEKEEEVEIVRSGKVTFFNESKGYGFIRDLKSQESIFVHVNGIETPIQENDKVTFETAKGNKGPVAVKVRKV